MPSSGVASAMEASTSSVAGLCTSKRAPLEDARHSPSMKSSAGASASARSTRESVGVMSCPQQCGFKGNFARNGQIR